MCLSSCWGAVRRNVTKLELVMFFFMFALFMVVITSQVSTVLLHSRYIWDQLAKVIKLIS